jgi:hypothetical protein
MSQEDFELKGPSVPVVRAPIFEHAEQYQWKYQLQSAAIGAGAIIRAVNSIVTAGGKTHERKVGLRFAARERGFLEWAMR